MTIQLAVGRVFAVDKALSTAVSTAGGLTVSTHPATVHVARRLQHMLTGAAFVAVPKSRLLTREQSASTLLACAAGFYIVHLLRLRWPALQRALEAAVASIARPHEIAGAVPASFFFLLGSGLACAAFDLDVYALSVAMLAVGDPAVSSQLTYYYHPSRLTMHACS
jgi:dolichol kinase